MPDPLPDLISAHLDVIFCGINPGLSAAAAGHHFVGRGNRFWRALHLAGFTPQEILPENDRTILACGYGLTTVAPRPTARADQLLPQDFAAAAARFEEKISLCAPRFVAFLGKAAYSTLVGRRDIAWGPQPTLFADAVAWLLPNPSGRNRAFTLDRLVAAYAQLHRAVKNDSGRGGSTRAGERPPVSFIFEDDSIARRFWKDVVRHFETRKVSIGGYCCHPGTSSGSYYSSMVTAPPMRYRGGSGLRRSATSV